MKLVFSRKGFDLRHGGMPSPILPNGRLLSLPIPCESGPLTYHDLQYNNTSYFELIKQLKPKLANQLRYSYCHLDPDLSSNIHTTPKGWRPAFGQHGPHESHLKAQCIEPGDLFLFFGWFKQTAYDCNGHLYFLPNAPDLDIIYGYLQIDEIITQREEIERQFYWHPHGRPSYTKQKNNSIYLPRDEFICADFSNPFIKGYNLFSYHKSLVLTKEGHRHFEWILPSCFHDSRIRISYHNNLNNGFLPNKDYFQSAQFGQEYVVSCTSSIISWLSSLLMNKSLLQ